MNSCILTSSNNVMNNVAVLNNSLFSFPSWQSDFNECDKETHNCHKDATCHNTDGSFECKCKDGYQGDGTTACGKTELP